MRLFSKVGAIEQTTPVGGLALWQSVSRLPHPADIITARAAPHRAADRSAPPPTLADIRAIMAKSFLWRSELWPRRGKPLPPTPSPKRRGGANRSLCSSPPLLWGRGLGGGVRAPRLSGRYCGRAGGIITFTGT